MNNHQRAKQNLWREEIERALDAHGGNDVVIPYPDVARAFPSDDPNPNSFHDPLIDREEFKSWALQSGWLVRPAPDMSDPERPNEPPIRFTKIP